MPINVPCHTNTNTGVRDAEMTALSAQKVNANVFKKNEEYEKKIERKIDEKRRRK
jgi:hypothetical protein